MANLILKPLVSVLTASSCSSFEINNFVKKTDDLPPILPPVPIPPGGIRQ